MKTKELTLKQMNSVRCTACGAATGEPCELHSGALRFQPHRDRKLSAADALERNDIKRKAAIFGLVGVLGVLAFIFSALSAEDDEIQQEFAQGSKTRQCVVRNWKS